MIKDKYAIGKKTSRNHWSSSIQQTF